MATFDFLATENFFISKSSGGNTISLSAKNNLPRALVLFLKEGEKRSTDLLKTNVCALCHEMAQVSMPTRANTALTANDALSIYEKENAALANVAFKPQVNRSVEFWVMSNFIPVAQYVMNTGIQLKNPLYQRLAQQGKWAMIQQFMTRKGFTVPQDAPPKRYVKDKAELRDFISWKSKYKKNPRTHNYYVEDKSSIKKIEKEKSLYNYASIVLNGWLMASKQLGDVLPAGVRKINWPHGKSLGWGSGKIKRNARGHVTITIENKYANLNNIFYGSMQQSVFKRRMALMDSETKKMFKDLVAFWNSLKV